MAALLPSCGASPSKKKEVPIILVHGIFDDSNKFLLLKHKLTKSGYTCHSPDLKPNNGKNGLAPLAEQLNSFIKESVDVDKPFHLLGYSMGGIISRYYLAHHAQNHQCASLTTLATPHHGTKLAYLYPRRSGIELRPNSDFLNKLNANKASFHPNTLSIRTPLDGVIIPSESSNLPDAKNISVISPTHPSLIVSKRVSNLVISHLEESEASLVKTSTHPL